MLSLLPPLLLATLLAAPTPPLTLDVIQNTPNTVLVSVLDANGVPPAELKPAQFSLRIGDGPNLPAKLAEPISDDAVRVSLMLVIDTSGSMAGKPLADAKAAAKQLLAVLGPNDRAAVIALSDRIRLDEPFPQLDPARERDFTLDKVGLANFVDGLSATGNTPLYDAAVKAIRLTAREAQTQPGSRRAVIFLTDGRDEAANGGNGSQIYNDDSAIFEAKAQRVPMFTIGLGNNRDRAFLTRLATLSGGDYQDAPDSAQLNAQFRAVLLRMKTLYRLTFDTPTDQGRLRVSLKLGDETFAAEGQPIAIAPVPTPSAVPTAIATPISLPTSASPATPVPPVVVPLPSGAVAGLPLWVGLGSLGLLLLVLIGVLTRRRSAPRGRKCMRCGHVLGSAVVCEVCGERAEK